MTNPESNSEPLGPLRKWFRRHFSDVEVLVLTGLLLVGLGVLLIAGHVLAPVIASIVVAYLLDAAVVALERAKVPRLPAVVFVWFVFLGFMLALLLVLLPLLLGQVGELAQMLPSIFQDAQARLLALPEYYPELVGEEQAQEMVRRLNAEVILIGQRLFGFSIALLPTLVTIGVYLILLPLLVFFFLKDKHAIIDLFASLLPRQRQLVGTVWHDVNRRVGGYVRGKLYEILIVGAVSYPAFVWVGLDFAALLAAATAFSVLVPYIGVVVAAIPVALVGFGQWGAGDELMWAMIAYTVIQLIDGNILAPLLLSGTMDLHPITIVVAILVFGAVWGFWGVFFAVPLAALAQAVFNAWPRYLSGEETTPEP